MSKPQKGSPEWDLWIAAIEVAIHAPWHGGQYVHAGKVPWKDIYTLREALDKVGIDWRTAKKDEDTRIKEQSERVDAERTEQRRQHNLLIDAERRAAQS